MLMLTVSVGCSAFTFARGNESDSFTAPSEASVFAEIRYKYSANVKDGTVAFESDDSSNTYIVDLKKQTLAFTGIKPDSVSSVKNIIFADSGNKVISEFKPDNGSNGISIAPGTGRIIITVSRSETSKGFKITGFLTNESKDKLKAASQLGSGLAGKKLSVIGDSITAYDGFIPEGFQSKYPYDENADIPYTDMWWYKVSSQLGCEITKIYACAGMGMTNIGEFSSSTTGRTLSLDDVDITNNEDRPDAVIIWIGGNDAYLNADASVIKSSYDKLVDNIRKTDSNIQIYICTYFSGLDERINRLNDIIRAEASEKGLILLEMSGSEVFDINTDTIDGNHPNSGGFAKIASRITETIKASD